MELLLYYPINSITGWFEFQLLVFLCTFLGFSRCYLSTRKQEVHILTFSTVIKLCVCVGRMPGQWLEKSLFFLTELSDSCIWQHYKANTKPGPKNLHCIKYPSFSLYSPPFPTSSSPLIQVLYEGTMNPTLKHH